MQFQKSFLILALLIFKAQIFCMIDTDEANLVGMREKNVVKPTFSRVFGPESNFQRIAAGVSGGGFRSMISGVGLLAGLQQIGLYDCVTYTAGVSGGTWAILPLSLRSVNPLEYVAILKNQICCAKIKRRHMLLKLWKAQEYSKIQSADLWGTYIGEKLLGDLYPTTLSFEIVRKNLTESRAQPFPIFTTVIGQTAPNYQWLEVSPFSVYSNYLRGSIPTCALGSKFEAGYICGEPHEKMLEFFIGLFGSAFSFTTGDLLNSICESLIDKINTYQDSVYEKLNARLTKISQEIPIYTQRYFATKLPNYSLHIPESQMSTEEYLQLIDAGYSNNLPIPPLLRPGRAIDIFIICDASSDTGDYDFTQLREAACYAEASGKKFPSLHKFKEIAPNLKIFYEEDPAVPMIIYFEDSNQVSVLKMDYTEAEFDSLWQNSYTTIVNNIGPIIEAVKKKAGVPNNFATLPDHC